MTCASIQSAAGGLALLGHDDPERLAADAHASTCPACTRALARGSRLLAALDALPLPEPPSAQVLARVRRALDTDLAVERSRRPLAVGALALAVVAGFLVIGARGLAHGDLMVPIVTLLGAIATAVAATTTRRALPALGAAILASTATAVLTGGDMTFEVGPGFVCLGEELLTGAVATASLWLLDRRHGTRRSAATWATVAASGALAGQAGLLLRCGAVGAGHGLVFHVAGVVMAAALASSLGRKASEVA